MEVVISISINDNKYLCHCPKCGTPEELDQDEFQCHVGACTRDLAIVICGKCNEQYAVD